MKLHEKPFGIAIHGGAGTILREQMSEEKEEEYRSNLNAVIQAANKLLNLGGTAIDAVELAVMMLEDCPLFNAGKGSVFTAQGGHEMDASIMDGTTLEAGAVSLIKSIKNPVQLARKVMEKSGHVFLAGEGAEKFAFEQGFEKMNDEYFYTDFRYEQLKSAQRSNAVVLDHTDLNEKKFGTVGAVALDIHGRLAAATSTGGMTNKQFGRVGDTPMIGSGTYADDRTVAVSCTGSGEYFIRANVAFQIHSMMLYGQSDIVQAASNVVQNELTKIGGDGGIIAIDRNGRIHFEFNTPGMYRASQSNGEEIYVGIYK